MVEIRIMAVDHVGTVLGQQLADRRPGGDHRFDPERQSEREEIERIASVIADFVVRGARGAAAVRGKKRNGEKVFAP
jgi:hypothetical protein